jgi:hypothetical protein
MYLLAFTIKQHTMIRLEEVGAALAAVAGALLFLGAMTPMGRRGTQLLAGLALAVGGVLVVIAIHWGT